MLIFLQILLLLIRVSGSPSPAGGGDYAPLAPVDPAAFCAAVWQDAGVEPEPFGPAWHPGNEQTVDCFSIELNKR